MSNYATLQDVINLWKPLSNDEQTKVGALLPLVSNLIRSEATKVGKDFDEMISEDSSLKYVAKMVTVDVVKRYMNQSVTGEAMSQESQSALGYSWSGTYAVPGGGLGMSLLNNERKILRLKTQRIGVIDLCSKE